MPRMFPQSAELWIFSHSFSQYSFAQRLAVRCAMFRAADSVFSHGLCLYASRASRLVSMTGTITCRLALNQSWFGLSLLPNAVIT